ncbi:MAG: DUF5317 family protein [Actinomycetota bacterium]
MSIAIVIGYFAGGRLSGLARLDLRWPALALVGVALQFAPWSGMPGFIALILSFAGLIAFALANAKQAGFILIVVGLAMNLTVIAVNSGMPVTRASLVSSGQADTLTSLVDDGGNKHHLAGPTDALVVLGDWIPLGPPVRQSISVGDIFVHAGLAWFIIVAMRRGRSGVPASDPDPATEGAS